MEQKEGGGCRRCGYLWRIKGFRREPRFLYLSRAAFSPTQKSNVRGEMSEVGPGEKSERQV